MRVHKFEGFLNESNRKLESFDIDDLDQFERFMYDDISRRNPNMKKSEILQVLINAVEGDTTQLSPELAAIAEESDGVTESNEQRGYALWKYDPKTKKAEKLKTGVMHEVGIDGFYYSKLDTDGTIQGAFALSVTKEDVERQGANKIIELNKKPIKESAGHYGEEIERIAAKDTYTKEDVLKVIDALEREASQYKYMHMKELFGYEYK